MSLEFRKPIKIVLALKYVEPLGLSKPSSMADTIKCRPSKRFPRNTCSGGAGNGGVHRLQIGEYFSYFFWGGEGRGGGLWSPGSAVLVKREVDPLETNLTIHPSSPLEFPGPFTPPPPPAQLPYVEGVWNTLRCSFTVLIQTRSCLKLLHNTELTIFDLPFSTMSLHLLFSFYGNALYA